MDYHKFWNGLIHLFLFLPVVYNSGRADSETAHSGNQDTSKLHGLLKEDTGRISSLFDSNLFRNYKERLSGQNVQQFSKNALILTDSQNINRARSAKYRTLINKWPYFWKKFRFPSRKTDVKISESSVPYAVTHSGSLDNAHGKDSVIKFDLPDLSGQSSSRKKEIFHLARIKRETAYSESVKNDSYVGNNHSAAKNSPTEVLIDDSLKSNDSSVTKTPLKVLGSTVEDAKSLKSFSENISTTRVQETSHITSPDTAPTISTADSTVKPTSTNMPSVSVTDNIETYNKIHTTYSSSKSTIGTTATTATITVSKLTPVPKSTQNKFSPTSSVHTSLSSTNDLTNDTQTSFTSLSPTSPIVERTTLKSSWTSISSTNNKNVEITSSSKDNVQIVTSTESSSQTSSILPTTLASSTSLSTTKSSLHTALPLIATNRTFSSSESPKSSTKAVIMSSTPRSELSSPKSEKTTTSKVTSTLSKLSSSDSILSKSSQNTTAVMKLTTVLSTLSNKSSVSELTTSGLLLDGSHFTENTTVSESTTLSTLRTSESTPHGNIVSQGSTISSTATPVPEHVTSFQHSSASTMQQTPESTSTGLSSPPTSEPVSKPIPSHSNDTLSNHDSTVIPTSSSSVVVQTEASVSAGSISSTTVHPKLLPNEPSTMSKIDKMTTSTSQSVSPVPESEPKPSSQKVEQTTISKEPLTSSGDMKTDASVIITTNHLEPTTEPELSSPHVELITISKEPLTSIDKTRTDALATTTTGSGRPEPTTEPELSSPKVEQATIIKESSTSIGNTKTDALATTTSSSHPEPTTEPEHSSSSKQLISSASSTQKGLVTVEFASVTDFNRNITDSPTSVVTSDRVEADTRETVTLVPDMTISDMPSLPNFSISGHTDDYLSITTEPKIISSSDYVTLDSTTLTSTGTQTKQPATSEPGPETTVSDHGTSVTERSSTTEQRITTVSEPEPETTVKIPSTTPEKHVSKPEPEGEPETPWLPNDNTSVKPSDIPSKAEPTMDIAFAEPGPDWETAFPLWKGAWDAHIYLIGILFFILAIYMFISIVRLWRIPRLLSRPYFLTLNFLIFFTCSIRAFYLLYGKYNAQKQFHVAVNYFLYSIAFPCLTASFSILFYALLQATKMRFLSPNVQRLPVLITIIVFHFLFSIVTDIFVGQFASSHLLLFICQLIFVTWGFFLFIGYIFIFRRLYLSAKNRQKAMQQVIPSAKGSLRNKLTLSLGIKVTMLAAVFGFLIVVLEIYAMSDVYNVFSTKIPEPWPWFIFETLLRLTEWFMCLTMAYVASQPFRGKKNNTHGWLFYFTSCMKMISCGTSKEDSELQWSHVKESMSMSECYQNNAETSKPVSGTTKLKNKIKQLNFLEKKKAEKPLKNSKSKSTPKSMLVVEEGLIRFRREDEMSEAGTSESTTSSGKINEPSQNLPPNGNITNVNKHWSNGIVNNGYSNTFEANRNVGSYSHRNSISSGEIFRGPSSIDLAASIEWELDKTIYGKKRTDPDGISLHSTYSSPLEGYDKKHKFCSSTPQTILKQYSNFGASNESPSKMSEKYHSQSTLSLKSTSSEHSVFLKKEKSSLLRSQSENPDGLPIRTLNSVKYYSLTDLEEQIRDSESDDADDHLRVVEELRRFSIVSQNLNKVLGVSDRSSAEQSLSDISVNSRVQFIEGAKDEEQSFC